MARSSNIYLVRHRPSDKLLGAFTVKYEAARWALKCPHHLACLQLSRMRDGDTYDKTEDVISWPPDAIRQSALDTRKLEPNDYKQECQSELRRDP